MDETHLNSPPPLDIINMYNLSTFCNLGCCRFHTFIESKRPVSLWVLIRTANAPVRFLNLHSVQNLQLRMERIKVVFLRVGLLCFGRAAEKEKKPLH